MITNSNDIVACGVMMTPVLTVNGQVEVVGKVPTYETIGIETITKREIRQMSTDTISIPNSSPQCARAVALKHIFPCSGASDVGEIADGCARRLT